MAVAIECLAAEPLLDPFARIQSQLTPPNPFQVPLSEGAVTLNASPSESIKLPDPGYARSLAQRAVSGLQQLANTLRQNTAMIDDLTKTLKGYDERLAALKQQKISELSEMRQGLFCTGCGRTRSDILTKDPSPAVFPHAGMRIRGATQEELTATAKKFDDQIRSLETEKFKNSPILSQAIFEKQRESEAAAQQIKEGINFWRMATTLERTVIEARDYAAEQSDERTIKDASDALNRIKRQLADKPGSLDPASVAGLEGYKKFWEQLILQTQEQGVDRQRSQWIHLQKAKENEERDYREIVAAMRSIAPKPLVHPTVATILQNIPLSRGSVSVSMRADTTGAHPVGIDQVGFKFRFGKPLSGSLMVDTSDPIGMEIKACAELLGTLQVCMHRRTVFGPNGVRTEEFPSVNVHQSTPQAMPIILNETTPPLSLP